MGHDDSDQATEHPRHFDEPQRSADTGNGKTDGKAGRMIDGAHLGRTTRSAHGMGKGCHDSGLRRRVDTPNS